MVAFFAILSSCIQLITAVSPGIEMHSTNAFFGDIVTISNFEAKISSVIFAVVFFVTLVSLKTISRVTFEWVVLNKRTSNAINILFNILSISTISFSVIFLGILFTIANLFIPALFLRLFFFSGILKNAFVVCFISFLSLLLGFFMSLRFDFVPTVPAIVLSQILVGFVTFLFAKIFKLNS
ncbi:MAG: metal ABC transporter permease [Silvanigrellaceae bacterium]|nr:metal ABC transporter permease [Silvanigrellaceae bacterium]